jgi:recombination protein RecA
MTDKLLTLADEMTKLFGVNADTEPKNWLDMGYPPLNEILSGDYAKGLPYGRMTEIFGPPASGKTLIATIAMIAAQKAGGVAVLVDWERAFKKEFGAEMGLDITYPRFIHLQSKTWEAGNMEALAVAKYLRDKKAIAPEAPIVIVYDSIAAAVPKSKMYDSKGKLKALDEMSMNDTTALARATSSSLPSIVQHFEELNAIGIYLNQVREKPGVIYGPSEYTPGGKSPEFYASTRLSIKTKKVVALIDGEKEFTGREITLETVKSKTTRPFQKVDLRLMYDERDKASFDFTTGMIEYLVDAGKIATEGNYRVWEGKKYYVSQLKKKIDDEGTYGELVKLLTA